MQITVIYSFLGGKYLEGFQGHASEHMPIPSDASSFSSVCSKEPDAQNLFSG